MKLVLSRNNRRKYAVKVLDRVTYPAFFIRLAISAKAKGLFSTAHICLAKLIARRFRGLGREASISLEVFSAVSNASKV